MHSHPLNSEAGQQAMERIRTGPVTAFDRASKARRYEQIFSDLQKTDAPTFISQLIGALQGMTEEEGIKLHAAWISHNALTESAVLHDAHDQYLHVMTAENFE